MERRHSDSGKTRDSMLRYRFRIWDSDLSVLMRTVLNTASLAAIEEVSHLHIVPAQDSALDVRLLGGRLRIERIVGSNRGLEHWRLELSEAFPLHIRIPEVAVSTLLAVDSELLPRSSYDARQFPDEVIRPSPYLLAVTVPKKRYLAQLECIAVEFEKVQVGRTRLHTLAIEGPDARSVLEASLRLGVHGNRNVNYPGAIKAALRNDPPRVRHLPGKPD